MQKLHPHFRSKSTVSMRLSGNMRRNLPNPTETARRYLASVLPSTAAIRSISSFLLEPGREFVVKVRNSRTNAARRRSDRTGIFFGWKSVIQAMVPSGSLRCICTFLWSIRIIQLFRNIVRAVRKTKLASLDASSIGKRKGFYSLFPYGFVFKVRNGIVKNGTRTMGMRCWFRHCSSQQDRFTATCVTLRFACNFVKKSRNFQRVDCTRDGGSLCSIHSVTVTFGFLTLSFGRHTENGFFRYFF